MENERGRLDLLTQEQISWCYSHCSFEWFVKDDGKVYSRNGNILFENKKTIVLFLIKFGDCRYFSCYNCNFLKSLEEAPENVNGDFTCSYCNSLQSLKGVSKNISGYFSCSNCDLLKSLEGSPGNVGGNFNCFDCDSLKYIDGLKNIKIGEKINYYGCPKLKKYDQILSDMDMFRKWQKTDLTADEFLEDYDGFLEAQKYGI